MKKFIVILIFVAAVFGCQRDEFLNQSVQAGFSIEQAKVWYEAHKTDMFELKSGNGQKVKDVKPDWNNAQKSTNDKEELVEADIMVDGGFGFATPELHEAWKKTGNEDYIRSHTRLVVVKNKKNKTEVGFFMTIAGNKEYVEKKNFNVSENKYLKMDKDFNGHVLFHNLDGSFSNGWKYTNGKVTHTAKIEMKEQMELRLKSTYCNTTVIYYWVTTCTDYYYLGSYKWMGKTYTTTPRYSYTKCSDALVFGGTITECTYIADETISGGGGYNPIPTPDPDPCNCNNVCPNCGGCLDGDLKSVDIPGGSSGTGSTSPCRECNCAQTFPAENALGVDMTGPAEAPDDSQKIAAFRKFLAGTEKTISDSDGKVYFWYNGYLCCYYNGQWYGEYEEDKWENFVPKEFVFSVKDKIESLFGKNIANIAVFASRYVLPFEDVYIVWTGVDFSGIESNTQVAAAFLLLEFVPGNDILKGYKPVSRIIAGTEMIVKYEGKAWKAVFKEFKSDNCRYNLGQFTGIVPDATIQAHHVFPQADRFLQHWQRVGINNNEPWYMQWWQYPYHQDNAEKYNKAWDLFFAESPYADYNLIMAKGRELMNQFNFDVFY